jgi:SpoVK/Ycf46/Vps4 family AAA+-type ATPase
MFASPAETLARLESAGYFTDIKVATAVFLAASIHRPILLEGPAGAGKTELAQSVARASAVPLLRLQCYQGIDEEKAIGQYDRSLQELYVLLMSRSTQTPDWSQIKREITSRAYFQAGPLLEAIEQEDPCVLLIDEIDKVDYAFEAQAFKRACSCFGLGRYFYNFAEMWVDLDEYKHPREIPALPSWALPEYERRAPVQNGTVRKENSNGAASVQKGPLDASVTGKIEACRRDLGQMLYNNVLGSVAKVRSARDIPNQRVQQEVLKWMESGVRGMAQVRRVAAEIAETEFYEILDGLGIRRLDEIQNFGTLARLVEKMNEAQSRRPAA